MKVRGGKAAGPAAKCVLTLSLVSRSWPLHPCLSLGLGNKASAGWQQGKCAGEAAASWTTQRVFNYYIKHLLCLSRIG